MEAVKLSIILPVRDIGLKISQILRYISAQTEEINSEFIVVDMGSSDNTVLQAVQLLKELNVRGFVIQSGNSTVSMALNAGIKKASGNYITFIFARKLYDNYIKGFLHTAVDTSADIIFGSLNEDESYFAERRLISKSICQDTGTQYIKNIINKKVFIDISAIMLRRKFILEKQICFFDLCSFGYSEEFIFQCLLSADIISQSPTIIKRNHIYELRRGKQKPIGKNIFQHTDAIIRILDIIKTNEQENADLIKLFEHEKLPFTIMNGIDIMLKEGIGYSSVRGYLHAAGYDKLLVTGKQTDRNLKRRIAVWRIVPWIYKPKK